MTDTNDGLTQGQFRSLLGQLWHHYARNEKNRAASFLALLEVSLSERQTHQMVELLDEYVYDELVDRGAVISERLQVLRLDATTLTLACVVRDSDEQIIHIEQYIRFIAQHRSGLVALLDQAEYALGQPVLGEDEEIEQHKRDGLGRTGWESLHNQRQSMARAVTPDTAADSTVAATDVSDAEEESSDEESYLPMLIEQLDAAFAADKVPALCLAEWMMELEAEEEQLVWQRYPRGWLESIMEATEEDRTEMRVLRRGDTANTWLHLTDCTFTHQDVLVGYVDDTFYVPDLATLAMYLQDCRQALQLPIVEAFDFDNEG